MTQNHLAKSTLMRFDLIGLQFEVRTEGGETQQGAEKPREISFSLLHRMKYSQIVLTKRLMHRARFIRFLPNFATM
jgi:hypothetical protein